MNAPIWRASLTPDWRITVLLKMWRYFLHQIDALQFFTMEIPDRRWTVLNVSYLHQDRRRVLHRWPHTCTLDTIQYFLCKLGMKPRPSPFLARVSKSFKSTFLLSRFPVQLWSLCHGFTKLLYLIFFVIFFQFFIHFFFNFFWLYRHVFLSNFDNFCHPFPKLLYLINFSIFQLFDIFSWLLILSRFPLQLLVFLSRLPKIDLL